MCMHVENNFSSRLKESECWYIYVQMGTYVYVCIRFLTADDTMHVFVYIYVFVYVCKNMCICVFIRKILLCMYLCIDVSIVHIYICIYIYTYICIYKKSRRDQQSLCVYMYVCMYVYLYVYVALLSLLFACT